MVSNFTKIVVGSAIGARIGTSGLRQSPPALGTDGYGTWIFVGLVMTLPDVLWIYCVWPIVFLLFMGACWFLVTLAICIAGIREVRATRRK
jgi:hypothetical protein